MGDAPAGQITEIERKLRNAVKKEVEIKLRIAGAKAVVRQLCRAKATRVRPRMHEMNTLYDTSEGALAGRGQILRIRVERPAGGGDKRARAARALKTEEVITVTYKGAAEPVAPRSSGNNSGEGAGARRGETSSGRQYKVRDEREVRVTDANACAHVLAAFDLKPRFRYEKYRTTYHLPSQAGVIEVDLDETPIGNFLELEGSRRAIDRAARALGFGPADYIVESYGDLHAAYCRSKKRVHSQNETGVPSSLPDMLFSRGTRRALQTRKDKIRSTAR